jgi:D-lactate dehydrogenase
LIAGLKAGRIGGVALDVYEEEEGIFFEDFSRQGLAGRRALAAADLPQRARDGTPGVPDARGAQRVARVTVENIGRCARGETALPGTAL